MSFHWQASHKWGTHSFSFVISFQSVCCFFKLYYMNDSKLTCSNQRISDFIISLFSCILVFKLNQLLDKIIMLKIISSVVRCTTRFQSRVQFCQKKDSTIQKKQTANELTPKDFSQIDIRVGQILECWKHPESENIYCQKIKVLKQPETILQIGSGLQKYVTLDNMKGKVIVIVNLKPRKMANFQSHGMVVCSTSEDKTKCQLIVPQGQVGERIFLENNEQLFPDSNSFLAALNPKKKLLEKCLSHLKTDEQGYVNWKGIKLRTKAGYLKSNIKNALVY